MNFSAKLNNVYYSKIPVSNFFVEIFTSEMISRKSFIEPRHCVPKIFFFFFSLG